MPDPNTLLIGLLIGLPLGGLIAWLWALNQKQPLLTQLAEQTGQVKNQEVQLSTLERQLQQARIQSIEHQEQTLNLTADLSRMQASYAHLNEELSRRQADLEALQGRMQKTFQQMAGEALESNARKLSDDQQRQLGLLLQPLQERLNAFEKRVEETYQSESRERFSLQREVERLFALNQQMSEDAQNLTRALKGDSKAQGNWGELVLARVLESSGLREGQEFTVQAKGQTLQDADGRRLQPDVIIHLPDQKHLIIDAKVSLTAYERYVAASEEDVRSRALHQHLQSVTTHINQLSTKHYSQLKGLQSPDFVLMFMPVEPAFSLALQAGKDLFSYAWERRIVLVSPTTLLATLKTVASLWRLEQQNRNAEEIARQGGALYDKFVGFVDEMKKIGQSLDRTQRQYHDALNKLHLGHGSLSSRAEKLKRLGVPTRKELEE